MRVFAVAQRQHPLGLERERRREDLAPLARRCGARRQVRGDGRVVFGGPPEGVLREPKARRVAERAPARPELVEDGGVLRRGGDGGDTAVIVRGGPDHRGPADIDLLDRLLARHAGPSYGLDERIERADHQVDGRDAVLLERGQVLGHVLAGQDPAVDLRMQRLHATVEYLGESGRLRYVDDPDTGVADELGGAAGRDDLHAEGGEPPGELDDPGLVMNADQRPPDFHRSPFTRTLRPTTERRPSANRRTASGYRRCSSARIRADSVSSESSGRTVTLA